MGAGAVPELTLTGPISPGERVLSAEGSSMIIASGSTVVYSNDGIMHMMGADGTEQFYARENRASRMYVPGGRTLPVTRIFRVPSEAGVNRIDPQTLTVIYHELGPTLTIKEQAGRSLQPYTSGGIYYLGSGGSVAVMAGDIMITTAPIKKPAGQSAESDVGYLFDNLAQDGGMSVICTGNQTSYSCAGLFVGNGTMGAVVDQDLEFWIVPGPSGNSHMTPIRLAARAAASQSDHDLSYDISGSSSCRLQLVNITHGIYLDRYIGPSRMYTGTAKVCRNTDRCQVSDRYTVNGTGTYYAHGTVSFILAAEDVGKDNPQSYTLMPDSRWIYY